MGTAINSSGLKHLAVYGACGGTLIVAMRYVEYRFLVVSHSVEIYVALIAAAFAAIGSVGYQPRPKTVIKELCVPSPECLGCLGCGPSSQTRPDRCARYTPRELEFPL